MNEMSQEQRVDLTRAIIGLMDSWGISPSEQIVILDLPDGTPARAVVRYRHDTPLPSGQNIDDRIEHLIGIADALRTTFPQNPQMGPLWMHKRNKKFRRRTPITTMVEDGLIGVIQVRSFLDCAYAWDTSGSVA